MPFTPPPLGAPPAPSGITASAPLNLSIGGAVTAGSNMLTASQFGPDITGVAFAINLAFQWLKSWEWLDQHRWWPLLLLALGVGAFLVMTGGDVLAAVPKGATAAMQAALNYAGQKAAGLGILEPSVKYPGSEEDHHGTH